MRLIFCCILLYASNALLAQNQRISLQIGISQYPVTSGWSPIHGLNDLDLLGPVFQEKGFELRQLRGAEATLAGIRAALNHLEAELKPGAMVHLHFSTHGQQIIDNNHDEFDGYDEAIVPYDAPRQGTPGQATEFHLRDDELLQRINALRERVGEQGWVWVTLDACHSGTATRLTGNFRGTSTPYGAKLPKRLVPDSKILDTPSKEPAYRAPLVVFSATSAQELNQEYLAPNGKLYGPLSFALAQCIIDPSVSTYVYPLFERIRVRFASIALYQTPQIEAENNAQLWPQGNQADQRFMAISKVWDAQTIMIGAGYLQGLYQGAALFLYDPGRKQAIGSGKVTNVNLQEAEIGLNQKVDIALLPHCFISTEKTPKNLQALRLLLHGSEVFLQKIRRLIQTEAGITEVEEHPHLIIAFTNKQYQLLLPDGSVLFALNKKTDDAATAEDLFEMGILPRMKAHYLRQLEMNESDLMIRPIFYTLQNGILQPNARTPVFKLGESFRLELTNTSQQSCYFHLLDIQPNDLMATIVPSNDPLSKPGDWILKAGESRLLEPTWRITPPTGREVIKILASNQPIDLSGFLMGDQVVSRGIGAVSSPLNVGNTEHSVARTSLSIQTIVIDIKP